MRATRPRACALLDELLGAASARAYEELKASARAVDFDDLELRARELLEEHDERARRRGRSASSC